MYTLTQKFSIIQNSTEVYTFCFLKSTLQYNMIYPYLGKMGNKGRGDVAKGISKCLNVKTTFFSWHCKLLNII